MSQRLQHRRHPSSSPSASSHPASPSSRSPWGNRIAISTLAVSGLALISMLWLILGPVPSPPSAPARSPLHPPSALTSRTDDPAEALIARKKKNPSAEDKKTAKRAYVRGTRLFDLHIFSAAIEEYKRGYLLFPDPSFLFNIAQNYRLQGKPQEAVCFYRAFLKVHPRAFNRDQVESFIQEMQTAMRSNAAPKVVANPVLSIPEIPRDDVEGKKLSSQKYDAGLALYRKGQFREAAQEFMTGYLVDSPNSSFGVNPRFLFMLGECHRKLGNEIQARYFYEHYLYIHPDASDRAQVERRIRAVAIGLGNKPGAVDSDP